MCIRDRPRAPPPDGINREPPSARTPAEYVCTCIRPRAAPTMARNAVARAPAPKANWLPAA
eukprot:1103771-Pyramimonas_sp.AAC.1